MSERLGRDLSAARKCESDKPGQVDYLHPVKEFAHIPRASDDNYPALIKTKRTGKDSLVNAGLVPSNDQGASAIALDRGKVQGNVGKGALATQKLP
jgi:hypothetical protein